MSQREAEASSAANFDALAKVSIRALRALGEAGEPVRASQIAAQGWSQLRHTAPQTAERLNGTMHYLARLPGHAIHDGATPHGADQAKADMANTEGEYDG